MSDNYPRVVESGPFVNGDIRIMQNRIRNLFILFENQTPEKLNSAGISIENSKKHLSFRSTCVFGYKNVGIVLTHKHGLSYANAFCEFFDLWPREYSEYSCKVKFDTDFVELSIEDTVKAAENMYKHFYKRFEKQNDEIAKKIQELTTPDED